MQLSIVIPFHENNSLLDRMVCSVLPQLLPEVELILVGDGIHSEVCKSIQHKYPACTVIPLLKAGANAARQEGMRFAKGKYIVFIDSDDILYPNALKTYLNIIEKHSPDLIVSNVNRYVNEQLVGTFYQFSRQDALILKENLTLKELYNFPVLLSCKCVLKKGIEDIHFDHSSMFQDFNVTGKLFKEIENVYFTNTITYSYYTRYGSISSEASNTEENIQEAIPSIQGFLNHYARKSLSNAESKYINMACSRFYFTLINRSIPLKNLPFSLALRSEYVKVYSWSMLAKTLHVPKAFLMGIIMLSKPLFITYYFFNLLKSTNH
jgi:glycosyltransferase involved in cell wall biosynthesis